MQFVNFKEGKIAYSEKGSGRAIIFLHGFMESQEIWKEYKSALSSRYRIVCIDLPGHGLSDCFGYVHSMELMAEALNAVLEELLLRKVFVVGHSMGGYTALALAEKYPDKIRGLCLFHSTAAADSPERRLNRDRALALVKQNHKKFVHSIIPLWFAESNRTYFKEEIEALKNIALKTPKQGIIAAIEGMKIRIDREMILKFSSFYLFYIIGKKDETIPFETVKTQTTLPNDCEYLILENAGHMGFIEAKDQCLKAIKKFAAKSFRKKQ